MNESERKQLEAKFHIELLALCDRTVVETNRRYVPTRFRQMVLEQTGVGCARELLNQPAEKIHDGLTDLILLERQDLSLECLVQQEPWRQLFTLKQLETARLRVPQNKCQGRA